MTDPIRLIHPIYLDVPMLVSFVAAREGGMSFESEVTTESERSKSANASATGKLALSKLFSRFLDVSAAGVLSGDIASAGRSVHKEARAHQRLLSRLSFTSASARTGGTSWIPSGSRIWLPWNQARW